MITREKVVEMCREEFHFLEADFGLQPVEESVIDWGVRLGFKSDVVGVVLSFELREFYLFVKLCRLQEGEFPHEPGEIRPETLLSCFDLDDITLLRDEKAVLPPHKLETQFNTTLARRIVGAQARNLKEYASDVLRGQFDVFAELDRRVKSRARDAAFRKWGDRARDYGWV